MGNPLLLLLRLEGPLQSWGERSRWDYRDTASMPTKSGVIGLLACALGKKRNDPFILALDKKLVMGVRMERPAQVMTDYQTASGTILTSEGKERGKKGEVSTLQSWRQYLQDAAYLVALSGEEGILKACAEALQHPVWTVYLGRKSCVPTRPIFEALTNAYCSLEDALQNYPVTYFGDKSGAFLCEIEDLHGGQYRRRDRVLGTPVRTFGDRQVRMATVFPKGVQE
jgi:CRISPR system Cascade subunit CasD